MPLNSNRNPELVLAVSGFILHGVWEFAHSQLYTDHVRGWAYVLWSRVHCTAGDVMILLVCFWLTAIVARSRKWFAGPNRRTAIFLFLILGLGYTTFSEWLNTTVRETWSYTEAMPTMGGIGLSPILQWIVIPPILIFILSKSCRS